VSPVKPAQARVISQKLKAPDRAVYKLTFHALSELRYLG